MVCKGQATSEIELTTNAYGFLPFLSAKVFQYDVEIVGILSGTGRTVNFTKCSKHDAFRAARIEECRDLFEMVKQKYPEVFNAPDSNYFYDNGRRLFTKESLLPPLVSKQEFPLNEFDTVYLDRDYSRFDKILFSVEKAAEDPMDVKEVLKHVKDSGKSIRLNQFLNVLTSQHALSNPVKFATYRIGSAFFINADRYDHNHGVEDLTDDKEIRVGCEKSVKLIAGSSDDGSAIALVDIKRTAFHKSGGTLLKKAREVLGKWPQPCDANRLKPHFIDLAVYTQHGSKDRRYVIDDVIAETPATLKFAWVRGSKELTLVEYFHQAYSIEIKFPRTPLAVAMAKEGRTIYLPLELCFVSPHQRVTTAQQQATEEMIKRCSIPPLDRQKRIGRIVEAMKISDNPFLQIADTGCKLLSTIPLSVTGRVIAPPKIRYGHSEIQKSAFLKPAKINSWAIVVLTAQDDPELARGDILSPSVLTKFARLFRKECKARGMQLPDPFLKEFMKADVDQLGELMRCLAQGDSTECRPPLRFLIFVTNEKLTDLHHPMKYFERQCGIITQDMKMQTVVDVVLHKKRQILENIVSKANIKNGGLNYSVIIPDVPGKRPILGSGRLIVGLFTSPTFKWQFEDSPSRPTALGYAANTTPNEGEFIGDCLIQKGRASAIQTILRRVLAEFKKQRRCDPADVIIYRSCEEGREKKTLEEDLAAVRSILKSSNPMPTLTVIAVQKRHGLRLMPTAIQRQGEPQSENLKPGTVLDSCLTDPALTEFYLNSHATLQGTARTPKYTVVHNDVGLSLEEMETLTYALSFSHQIVPLPTSLPSPLYIAGTYAERGVSLYQQDRERGREGSLESCFTYGSSPGLKHLRITA
ncbi:hypothetical protein L596_029060 [Steinernema carpocapsae]|uniref:Piwi domain-containing protein n=1 Tax=Steinernema carpocapsae TaxID=34508 RepID=A0A4U5LTI3_STECR|nr:hypothetical protein L596_029060 [Steinernema carpocapsae]